MKNKNSNQSGRKERLECSEDTKLFFDDVYKSDTRGKKQQVDVLQYGRSMIEMLGVLAIVGVLSVGGIAGYSKAMTKFKINKTADQISQIVTNIRTLYAQQTTYEGLDFGTAVSMGVIPDEMGTDNRVYSGTNPFSGDVWIYADPQYRGSSKNDSFIIGIGDLPKEACVSLATMDWGSSSSSGLIGMIVGGLSTPAPIYADDCTESLNWGVIHCSKDGPMNVATAATACECTSNCGIMWKFY